MYKDQNLGTCNFLEGALEHFSNPVKLESSLKIGWFSVKTVCKKMKTSVNQLSAHVAEASSSIRRTTYNLFGSYYHDSKKRLTDFSWPKPFWPGLLKCSAARYQAISKSIPIILFNTGTIERLTDITRSLLSSQRFWATPSSKDFWIHISASVLHLRWKSLDHGEFGLRFQIWMWYVTGQ